MNTLTTKNAINLELLSEWAVAGSLKEETDRFVFRYNYSMEFPHKSSIDKPMVYVLKSDILCVQKQYPNSMEGQEAEIRYCFELV